MSQTGAYIDRIIGQEYRVMASSQKLAINDLNKESPNIITTLL